MRGTILSFHKMGFIRGPTSWGCFITHIKQWAQYLAINILNTNIIIIIIIMIVVGVINCSEEELNFR